MRGVSLLAAVVPILLPACSPSDPDEGGILHPRPEFSVRPGQPAFVISTEALGPEAPVEFAAAGAVLRIGTLDAPDGEVFGQVQDAVVDGRGRVAVLDAQAKELRIFDAGSRLITTVGGPGMGPGQFRSPKAVALGPEGEFVVLDGLGGVSWFDLVEDSARFVRSFELRGDIFDGCILGRRVIVHGRLPGRDGFLHAYTGHGEHLASFGEAYRSGHAIIDYQLSRGRIACLPEEDLVLMALDVLPEIRAYTPAGDLEWWAEVSPFQPIHVTELPRGSRLGRPGSSYDVITALVPGGGGGEVILQLARIPGFGEPPETLKTLILNIPDRSIRHTPTAMGRILDSGPHHALTLRTDPYPRVELLKATGEGQ